MKNNSKSFIIIFVFVIVLVIVTLSFLLKNNKKEENKNTIQEVVVEKLSDGTKLNTSSKLSETKKVGNIEISKAQLTNKNGNTKFLAEVKNVSNTKINMLELEIILLSETGKEIEKLDGLIGTVKQNETAQLNASILGDYTNVYDYKVTIKSK